MECDKCKKTACICNFCKKCDINEIGKYKCRCGCYICPAWWHEDRGVMMLTIGTKDERVCHFCHLYDCICDEYENSNEDWSSDY